MDLSNFIRESARQYGNELYASPKLREFGSELKISKKSNSFTESVIREMTRLANKHGAVNLAQGFPDFACPEELKEAASKAIREDYNQYSVTWGAPVLRQAIAQKVKAYNKIEADPDKNIVVTCGTTEAM